MKRLLKNIILFCIPVLAMLIVLPVDKRSKYQGLEDDCFNHGIWVYDRIFSNEKPIDIAFLGSSRTINGIDDELITSQLKGISAVNLGYCRLGRNLTYVLLKEISQEKDLKTVVVEVREKEDRYSHPIFPHLAWSQDVVLPNPFFNRDMFSDMWTHFAYKIEVSQDVFYKQETAFPISEEAFGFTPHTETASTEYLDEVLQKKSIQKKQLSQTEQDFHNNFSRVYLRKISNFCDQNDIELYFLFMPGYGTPQELPGQYETYQKYGKVLIPPRKIFTKQSYWFDENHLNEAGARDLSLWIADEIETMGL